ncbi:MAG: hypothetical protein PHP44_00920 [Kiritimatiellae bacterium]|nr:hypothetical protein [Kiritimatiellia bacterium]
MNIKRMLLISFFVTLVTSAIFTWPLPRYLFSGIPASSTNVEIGGVRRMIEGDHLQMLYNYWIFSDMLTGQTPFWHNIYEFNTGDDSARRYVGPDLLPYSLIFTAGYLVGNRAFAWNLLCFTSLWMSYFICWLLVHRYTRETYASALGALLILYLPYRWASLLGGSPTGLSMLLPPLLFLGLDLAIRDARLLGGILAGCAMIVASFNDAHIFFMGMLAAPGWCLLALAAKENMRWLHWKDWFRMAVALLPFALIAGIPVIQSQLAVHGGAIESTTIEDGRSLREVSLFSPRPEGLFNWISTGHENSIFIGWLIPALLALGLLLLLWAALRRPRRYLPDLIVYLLLAAASIVLIILALGVNGPDHAHWFNLCRAHIPHYDMIRQPAKIYALFPPLLAILTALALRQILSLTTRCKPAARIAVLLFMAAAGMAYALQVRTTVCLLDEEQGAYAAVADDARAAGKDPRALIIPLWPGDSAWSSLYEHYVSLYRIRMLNGYLPVVPLNYINDIATFHEFSNVAIIPPAQWDDLRERGIDYILFHEDAFPEQVSNFPAAFTLRNLLLDPRLQLLRQDGNVWAFKLLEAPHQKTPPPALATWTLFLPTYNCSWEAEWGSPDQPLEPLREPSASGQACLPLSTGQSFRMHPFAHCEAPEAALLLRLRGNGTLRTDLLLDEHQTNTCIHSVHADNWTWLRIPAAPLEGTRLMQPVFTVTEGQLDLDAVISFAGILPDLSSPGAFWLIPAPLFFRAGYTDLEHNQIILRPDYQSDGGDWGIFYGPKLPIPAGTYDIAFNVQTDAPEGTPLGHFRLIQEGYESDTFPVIAGTPATATVTLPSNLPVKLSFNYARTAPLAIQSVTFTRK